MKKNNIYIITIIIILAFISCKENKIKINNGIYEGETKNEKPSGYGIWKNNKKDSIYEGFWINGKKEGTGRLKFGKLLYKGEFINDKFSGYGELSYNDSIIYSGEWIDGVKYGKGFSYDNHGNIIKGLWSNDSIVGGIKTDKKGTYIGQINQKGQAEGHGSFIGKDGSFYEGHWAKNKRNSFGFSITPFKHLKAGIWKKDKFKGERLLYTQDRIYGIDISQYQHIIGRKRYRIFWKKLRIINLGKASEKYINGVVNYPVSFIYIKSTQGTTIRNKYYKLDYKQARKHKIPCGSYHFFSTKSSPSCQAIFFLKHSIFKKGDFPPVLDVEPSKEEIKKLGGINILFKNIRIWMQIVNKKVGIKPILYVNQIFVNKYLPKAPDIKHTYNIWIARYGEYKPEIKLSYWQLSQDGKVKGIKGYVDINVFNGYKDVFEDFLQNKRIGM